MKQISFNSEKIQRFDLILFCIIFFQILFLINFFVGLKNQFYLQIPINSLISYKSEDLPGYPITGPNYLPVGNHYFGDFLLSYYWSFLSNPWLSGIHVNYPPLSIEYFRLFKIFDYQVALNLYLLSLLISMISPFVYLFTKYKKSQILILLLTVGFLNQPLLSTLDRGNVVGLLPLLIFFAGVFFLTKRYSLALVFIVLASSIKVYPAVLLILFLAVKKWKHFLSGILFSISSVIGPLALYNGNIGSTIREFFNNFFGFTATSFELITCRNSSFMGGLIRIANDLELMRISKFIYYHSFEFTIVLGLLTVILILSKNTPSWLKVVLSYSMFTTLPALSFSYSQNWIIAAIAIVLFGNLSEQVKNSKEQNVTLEKDSQGLAWVTLICLLILVTPWTFLDKNYPIDCGASYYPKIYACTTSVYFVFIATREIKIRLNMASLKSRIHS